MGSFLDDILKVGSDYEPGKVNFDTEAYMGDFDPLEDNLADFFGGGGSKFDDDCFNIDFLDALTDEDDIYGRLSKYSGSSSNDFLDGILGGADDDDKGFLERILGSKLAKEVGLGGNVSSERSFSLKNLIAPFLLTKALESTGMFDPKKPPVGYQGSIPKLKATREQVTGRDDTDRRPGSGGRRYFSDVSYTKEADTLDMAAGGLASLEGGGYLEGATDGQADLVPADIDGVQEARLSHGEYVLPADLVAILGNGNSDAGAKALDEFMSTVRKEATGTPKQQKNIDADKALQILMRG
jgi:hypothetical protein